MSEAFRIVSINKYSDSDLNKQLANLFYQLVVMMFNSGVIILAYFIFVGGEQANPDDLDVLTMIQVIIIGLFFIIRSAIKSFTYIKAVRTKNKMIYMGLIEDKFENRPYKYYITLQDGPEEYRLSRSLYRVARIGHVARIEQCPITKRVFRFDQIEHSQEESR